MGLLVPEGAPSRLTAPADQASKVRVIPLKDARAEDVARVLRGSFAKSGNIDASSKLEIVAEPTTNALVIQGNAEQMQRVTDLFLEFDSPGTAHQGSPLDTGRVVVQIDTLVQAEKWDEARNLADALAALAPDCKPAVSIQQTLADDKLNADARKARVSEIASESRKAIAAAEREAKLRHRLDERLYAWVTGKPDAPAPEGLVQQNGAVLVSVLLQATDDATLEEARKAGLSVQAVVASAKFVVGTAAREKLADLALLDAVRKIEPTQPEAAPR